MKFLFTILLGLVGVITNISWINAQTPINIIADSINIKDDGQMLFATGNVMIASEGYILTTSEITYDKKRDKILARGQIYLKNNSGIEILSDFSELSGDLKKSLSIGVQALINERLQIASNKVETKRNGNIVFYETVASSCKICSSNPDPIWQIKAKKITHNKEKKQLEFQKAWFEIGGLPLIYTPYLRTPEPGVKRASGLLPPSIISSNLIGFGIKQPYFHVIKQNTDLTFSILKTTKSSLIETEVRHLFSDGKVKLEAAVAPDLKANQTSSYLKVSGENFLNISTDIKYQATFLSHRDFLAQYNYNEDDRLFNYMRGTLRDEHSLMQLETAYFTSLRDHPDPEPLIFPKFSSQKYWFSENNTTSTETEFDIVALRGRGNSSLRLTNSTNIQKNWLFPLGVKVKSKGEILGTVLKHWNKIDTEKVIFRPGVTFSTEVKLPLIRKKNAQVEIIEPVLQLVMSPKTKSLVGTPYYDSFGVEFDKTNLFTKNRFPGHDKKEYGTRLNAGVKYYKETDGQLKYRVSIGQIYRDKQSFQFSEASGLAGKKSDVLISGFLSLNDAFKISSRQLYTKTFTLRRSETAIGYADKVNTLSGDLIYIEPSLKDGRPEHIAELSLLGSSLLVGNWKGSLGLRHNLATKSTVSTGMGLNFNNECVDFSINLSRRYSVSEAKPEDMRFEITFELGGGSTKSSKGKASCIFPS